MTSPSLSKVNDNSIVAFNTGDILIYLFKESVKEKQFTDHIARHLAHLDSQIAKTTNLIKEHLSTAQKSEWNAIKTLLTVAKDSPKRKELAQLFTELEEKAVNLNTQGEILLEQCRNLSAQFWNTLAHWSLTDKKNIPEDINPIKRILEDLNMKIQPLIEEEDILFKKFKSAKAALENMTGRTVESLITPEAPKI